MLGQLKDKNICSFEANDLPDFGLKNYEKYF
jgi:hypothetical protein